MIKNLSNYLTSILPDFILLVVLIISFYNNPYRFSLEKNFFKLSHYKTTYLIYFILIIIHVLIVYLKSFTFLNHTEFFSINLPFLLILIPFIGFMACMFVTNKVFIYKMKKGKEADTMSENQMFRKRKTDIDANEINTNNEFSSPPYYFLSKRIRLIISYIHLVLVLATLGYFINYITRSRKIQKSPLQGLLSNITDNKKASTNLIYTVFLILIFFIMLIIYQQHTYYPCRLGLPESWNF